jgi:tetratricopeptide (TPR) repeat protein
LKGRKLEMKILLLGIGNSPVRSKFVSNHIENYMGDIEGHEILTFGYNEGVDIKIETGADFREALARLPAGWQPDCCILWEAEWNLLPPGIESAPFPTFALISDWDYDIHLAGCYVKSVDCVIALSDFEKEALLALGARRVEVFHHVGAMREYFAVPPKRMEERKYDILYTSFIDDNAHPDRSAWILKLCGISDRYRVLVAPHLPGYKDYIILLRDSKLVLSHHRYGSMSGRVMEAGSQGAVVMDTGPDIRNYFKPDEEYIPVTTDDFPDQIERYLNDTAGLQAMSERFYKKVTGDYESRNRLGKLIGFIGALLECKESATGIKEAEDISDRGPVYYYAFFRTSQGPFIVNAGSRLLLMSIEEFKKAAGVEPSARALTNLAVAETAYGSLYNPEEFLRAGIKPCIEMLREAIRSCPGYVMAYFNLGLLYYRSHDYNNAMKVFKVALELFEDRNSDLDVWCLHNRDYDLFNTFLRKPLNAALLLLSRGEDEKGTKDIRSLYRAFILYLISRIEEKNKKIYPALDALLEASRLYPGSGSMMTEAAGKLALLGFRKESIDLYRKAIGLCPLSPDPRLNYVKLMYLYGMDNELAAEIKKLLVIAESVLQFKGTKAAVRKLLDSFTRFNRNPVYSFDPARDNVLEVWFDKLFLFYRSDLFNYDLVSRIVKILCELGRTDKAFLIMEDYTGRFKGKSPSCEEMSAIRNIYDYLRERSCGQARLLNERLSLLNNKFQFNGAGQ